MSIHPTTTNEEVMYVCESIKALAENFPLWAKDYVYIKSTNEFVHHLAQDTISDEASIDAWFEM